MREKMTLDEFRELLSNNKKILDILIDDYLKKLCTAS